MSSAFIVLWCKIGKGLVDLAFNTCRFVTTLVLICFHIKVYPLTHASKCLDSKIPVARYPQASFTTNVWSLRLTPVRGEIATSQFILKFARIFHFSETTNGVQKFSFLIKSLCLGMRLALRLQVKTCFLMVCSFERPSSLGKM